MVPRSDLRCDFGQRQAEQVSALSSCRTFRLLWPKQSRPPQHPAELCIGLWGPKPPWVIKYLCFALDSACGAWVRACVCVYKCTYIKLCILVFY